MRERAARLLLSALLLAAVAAVYSGSLHAPFDFDDWHVIEKNPAVHDPANVPSFFTDLSTFSLLPDNRDYRPVFLTSMALAWWAGGGDPLPFHVTAVALHGAVVLLLLSVFSVLFSSERDPAGGLPPRQARSAAFLGALLFAVHPLASEAVIYVSSQSILWAGLFELLALRLFLGVHHTARAPAAAGRWLRLGASWASFGLALLSKPIAITFPAILLLWEALFGRGPLRARIARQLPYLAVAGAGLFARSLVMSDSLGRGIAPRSLFEHYLTETTALVFYYLRLAVLPIGQNVDAEYPVATSLLEPRVLASLAALALIAAALVLLRRRRNVVFWTLWCPILLAVETYGVVLYQLVREGRAYLPLVGVCALLALCAGRLWYGLPARFADLSLGKRSGRALIATALATALAALALGTVARTRVWSSPLALWEDAARNGGTWRAHMNYGLALEEAGRADEALAEFERAVELGPYAFAFMNLGLAQLKRQDAEAGLLNLRRAVELWPASPEGHYYLGWGLAQRGQLDEARAELATALRMRPSYAEAQRELAQVEGRLAGDAPHALFAEAFALQQGGRRLEAVAAYGRLLALEPAHRQGAFNLAHALMQGDAREEWSRSAALFEKVLALDPGYSEALFHLATVRRRLGDAAGAAAADRAYLERGTHADLKQRAAERLAAGGE